MLSRTMETLNERPVLDEHAPVRSKSDAARRAQGQRRADGCSRPSPRNCACWMTWKNQNVPARSRKPAMRAHLQQVMRQTGTLRSSACLMMATAISGQSPVDARNPLPFWAWRRSTAPGSKLDRLQDQTPDQRVRQPLADDAAPGQSRKCASPSSSCSPMKMTACSDGAADRRPAAAATRRSR